MKLLIITTVDAHKPALIKMLKAADIGAYSSADISGHKKQDSKALRDHWFAAANHLVDSELYFSFVAGDKIDSLFTSLREYNHEIEDHSPIRAVVVPIEQSL